jgi:hypothetical protein
MVLNSIPDLIKKFHFMDNKFEIEIVGNRWKDDPKIGSVYGLLKYPD